MSDEVSPDDLEGSNLCVMAKLHRVEVAIAIRWLNRVKVGIKKNNLKKLMWRLLATC